jgi:hypothetical protein
MAETLVQRIRRIDEPSNPNRDQETREEFEQDALTNSASRAVRESNGKTTYHQQYKNTFGNYDDSGISFRPFLLPDGFKESIADLEDAIGSSIELRGSLYTALENPVGGAGLFGLGISGTTLVESLIHNPPVIKGRQSTRREFLAAGFIFGAAVGAVGGSVSSYARIQELKSMEQNAIYLDQTYSRVYKTASASTEHSFLVRNYFERFGIPNRA